MMEKTLSDELSHKLSNYFGAHKKEGVRYSDVDTRKYKH